MIRNVLLVAGEMAVPSYLPLPFGAVAVSVVSKTSSMYAGVLFSSAAPGAGASSTRWLMQPFLFGQLCHSCVCAGARSA